jgi:hypothetical protein
MKQVKIVSVKSQFVLLFNKEPRLTYRQYAERLGTTPPVIRAYARQLGFNKLYNPADNPLKNRRTRQDHSKPKKDEKNKRVLKTDHIPQASSSATRSRSWGYLKLI